MKNPFKINMLHYKKTMECLLFVANHFFGGGDKSAFTVLFSGRYQALSFESSHGVCLLNLLRESVSIVQLVFFKVMQ